MSTWNINIVDNRRLGEMTAQILEKLRQRCRGGEDEGKLMMLTFRHFDTNKSGGICLEEFTRALQNFGCYFAEPEVASLFNHYDTDNSGTIAYEEFCNVFAIAGSAGRH